MMKGLLGVSGPFSPMGEGTGKSSFRKVLCTMRVHDRDWESKLLSGNRDPSVHARGDELE